MRTPMAFLLAALGVVAACSDDIIAGPGTSGGDFAVSTGAGLQPVYGWSAGPAFTIDVVRTANPSVVVWRIVDPDDNDIRSPVTHGTKPDGVLETAARERTLTRGIEYRVTVTLPDGRSGFRQFTP